jgi:hypothetical protein
MKTTLIALLAFTLVTAEVSHAAMPLHASNDVEAIGDGWYRITGGDPHLVFRAVGTQVTPDLSLEAVIESRHLPNRHQYIEWFYATEKHGFSEEFKAFTIFPFSPKGTPLPQVYRLGYFLSVLGDASERIDLVRIDFEPELRKTDVQFRVALRWLESGEMSVKSSDLHPPYLSRFLLKPETIRYTISNLASNILQRTFRDWLFVVFYFGSISTLVILILCNRKGSERS